MNWLQHWKNLCHLETDRLFYRLFQAEGGSELLDFVREISTSATDSDHVISRLSFNLCSALRRWLCCRNPVEGCDYEENGVTYRTFCYNSNVFWKDYIFASGKDGGYYDERIDFRSKDGF